MTRFTKWALAGAMVVALAAGTAAQVPNGTLLADFDRPDNNSNFGTSIIYYVNVDVPGVFSDNRLMSNVRTEPDAYGSWFDYISFPGGVSGQSGGFTVTALPTEEQPDLPSGVDITMLPDSEYYPGFGMGIMLSDAADVGFNQWMRGASNFADVDSIVFWARSNVTPLTAAVKVATTEASLMVTGHPGKEDHLNENSYQALFTVGTEWTRIAFRISGVVPPETMGHITGPAVTHEWPGPNGGSGDMSPNGGSAGDFVQDAWFGSAFTFNPANVTQLQFAFNSNMVGNSVHRGEEVSLFIDDVYLVGANFSFRAIDDCVGCNFTVTAPATPNKRLADFEGSDFTGTCYYYDEDEGEDVETACEPDALQNSRGYFWYVYADDVAINEDPSEILDLVENYEGTGFTMDSEVIKDKGKDGTAGAHIDFLLGSGYEENGEQVAAFVGIGTELFNSKADTEDTADFLNARAFNGIFLEYRTTGNVTVNFELVDIFDIRDAGGAFNPSNPAGDDDGEVFYTVLQPTDGEWFSVFVPFSAFVLPRWVEQQPETRRRGAGKTYTFAAAGGNSSWNANELNTARLAELKFKVQGPAATDGSLSIDNVYFVGADEWGDATSIRLAGNSLTPRASAVRASYNRGVVNVSWDAASQIANGRVSLINVRGRTITSAPISNVAGNRITANLGRSAVIPTGMYFVRIDARDVNGKRITQQAPIRVVK
ncbi:MAG: hypothetical protein LBU70_06315 [Chitinispirillales bacterium]|jgi:hypothetical protein|nr:hypothetical protein [Chitinispirillales bacterium]